MEALKIAISALNRRVSALENQLLEKPKQEPKKEPQQVPINAPHQKSTIT